jgi:TonB family protein
MVRGGAAIGLIAVVIFACGAQAQQPNYAPTPPIVSVLPGSTFHRAKVIAIFAPKPEYPDEARKHHWTGIGWFVMHVDVKSGLVNFVEVTQSTGHKMLDDACVNALKRWRFKPGAAASTVKTPITFTRSEDPAPTFAPKPEYPQEAQQRHIGGGGLYQINVDKQTGLVTSVQIVRSAGDPSLNNAAIAALRQWRFKPGTVEKVMKAFNFDSETGTVLN